jgi:hypothetical protein
MLAFIAALGTRLNVTLGAIALCSACFVFSPQLHRCLHATWNASDWSLVVFVVSALVAITLSIGRLAILPIDVVMHSTALIAVCPLAYVFGSTVASHAGPAGIRTVFHLALIAVLSFLALTNWQSGLVSDEGAVVGSYYQYSGDCLAVVALLHLATRQKSASVWPILLVIPALLLVGSRASLAAYFAALMVSSLMPSIAVVCVVAIASWPWLEGLVVAAAPDLLDISRVITSLIGAVLEGREDASLLERLEYQRMAIASIADHPVLGDFGYDVLWNGYLGGFSHTALDLWAQYGVTTFLAFAGTILAAPLVSTLWMKRRSRSRLPGPERCLPLLVFLVVEFTFFRHPESVVLFFGIGALSGLAGHLHRVVVRSPVLALPSGARDSGGA